jgi:methylated-DNA-protein-cysteine methyltransferase-like protein
LDKKTLTQFLELKKLMSNYFQQIYRLVAQIPAGKVATYGQIAALIGNPRASRTVGWAMRNAPSNLQLPCHRVVYQSGALAPPDTFGSSGLQRALLESEGITFNFDDRVALEKHLWQI